MLARLADKLILQPTRDPIDVEHKSCERIPFRSGFIEAWLEKSPPGQAHAPETAELFVIKFPGTGGRAERATLHPAEVWGDLPAQVWTVNPPGYGGSSGPATLGAMSAAAEAVYRHVRQVADDRPVIVTGNSLGNISALHLAANFKVDGLLLRNPPPLRELIVGKHGWWTLGMAAFIAWQVPSELCALSNAALADCPALFVMSGKDRMVPPRFQQLVIDAHAGSNRVFLLPAADHGTPITEAEAPEYLKQLDWLRRTVGLGPPTVESV